MNYNIKWFEVEVWRGKPADEIPEYLKTDIVSESPVKSPISPNREKRSRAGGYHWRSHCISMTAQ